MAIFDISEVNNAVQITKDGNYDQKQKGYYGIQDPTTDNILYITVQGRTVYQINTLEDTITVNSTPFVGDSNTLKDTINPFFFNASSGGGGGAVDSVNGTFVDNADPSNPVVKGFQVLKFALPEEVQNTEVYLATDTQADINQIILSGNNGGLQNQGAASPNKVVFDGEITEALITVKGVGVQDGSVSYPVALNVDINEVVFTGENNLDTVSFQIPSDVGIFSVGNTNFQGTQTVSIPVTKGMEISAEFINGNGASVAGQIRNMFVSLVIIES